MNKPYWERPLIGRQPFKNQVWCCGRKDEAFLLSYIVGWAIDSWNAQDCWREIENLKARGFITIRLHKCQVGEWEAYALTEKGFDRLRQIGYGNMYDEAIKHHEFYASKGCLT